MTTGKVKLNKGITIGVLQALLLSLSVSAENNHAACTEMTKQFFLEKMRDNIGPDDTPLKDRPDLIRGLMMRINLQYPDSDKLACINDGLISARASLNIYVIDKMHGGVRSLR